MVYRKKDGALAPDSFIKNHPVSSCVKTPKSFVSVVEIKSKIQAPDLLSVQNFEPLNK